MTHVEVHDRAVFDVAELVEFLPDPGRQEKAGPAAPCRNRADFPARHGTQTLLTAKTGKRFEPGQRMTVTLTGFGGN